MGADSGPQRTRPNVGGRSRAQATTGRLRSQNPGQGVGPGAKPRHLWARSPRVWGRNSPGIPPSSATCNWDLAWARPPAPPPVPTSARRAQPAAEARAPATPRTAGPHRPLVPLRWPRYLGGKERCQAWWPRSSIRMSLSIRSDLAASSSPRSPSAGPGRAEVGVGWAVLPSSWTRFSEGICQFPGSPRCVFSRA